MQNETITLNFKELLETAEKLGIEAGIRAYQQKKEEGVKVRHNKNLRNTELLLQNYRKFKLHIEESIFDIETAKGNFISILDEVDDEQDNDIYIDSIKKSVARTSIIISHINHMLDVFGAYCNNDPRIEIKRQIKVIQMLYVNDEHNDIESVAETLNISRTSVFNSKRDAIQTLSSLLFGIDSINGTKNKNMRL